MPDDELVPRLRAAGCVFAEDEARLLVEQARTPSELALLTQRRVDGEPLEHVLGWAAFDGLRVAVGPGVFVPRYRSTLLVEQAVAAAPRDRRPVVVDLCCGTGALGLAVLARLGSAELHAADVDPAAVDCARRNLDGRGQVHEGDLYAALPASLRGSVDVLLASPPYVPTSAIALMPPEARDHEPATALDGGRDGLDVVRRLAAGAPAWLAPRGVVLVETGAAQAADARDAVRAAGLEAAVLHDEDGDSTAVRGRRSRPA